MTDGTLYGWAVATCTQKVLVVAHELGLDLNLSLINLMTGDQKKPPHINRQPFGQIPAYESASGVTLFESRAIARYLDAKAGGKLGQIHNLENYGLVETWISVETSNFDKYASVIVIELFYKAFRGMKPDEAEVEKQKANLIPVLDVYDKELATKKFLAGNEYTLADLFHLPFANHLFRLVPELLEGRENLKKWYLTLSALPSWQKVLESS